MFSMLMWRFVRSFIASAIGAMAVIVLSLKAETFADLSHFFAALGVAAIVGGVTGALLALDKWVRTAWSE